MELKTKYQYTYFIYPYMIAENKYTKYLQKLLKDKKCEIRFFKQEKDYDIFSYFLPNIRKFMFPTFSFNEAKIKKFKELDVELQATILQKHPCTIFEYQIGKDIQGKTGKENGIFFSIEKLEIICFHTGICFLVIKTQVENSEEFDDILNFNYKFRDIKSQFISLKQFENIKIQTSNFDDIKKLTDLIEEITTTQMNQLNMDTERFLTYSYTCIGQEAWNETKPFETIEHEFYKYCNILPSNYNVGIDKISKNQDIQVISKWKYIKIGFSKMGSCLLTSGTDTFNYTKLPFLYENVYFYMYILNLYKKCYLNKLKMEYKKEIKSEKARGKFINFTQNLWIQEVTNDDIGSFMNQKWNQVLDLDMAYRNVKNKFDILYKEKNIEKTAKTNKIIMILLFISVLLNILHFFG